MNDTQATDALPSVGPGAAFAWHGFSDHDWQAIETVVQAAIDEDGRAAIEAAAERYIVCRWVKFEESRRKRQRGRVDAAGKVKDASGALRLLAAIDRLTQVWNEVYGSDEERDVLDDYDSDLVRTGRRDLGETIADLEYHRIALRLWLRGDRPKDPFARLVRDLGHTFARCAGRRPTAGAPPADLHDAPLTPFVAFVKSIDRALPEAVRRDGRRDNSAAAWSKAVSRALKDI